ncbi:MAG: Glucosamine-6-phosphate deaminase [Firmicutes bacterium ADurb.Bin080]|jgi:glucosamine-6-phosphate deaminase|nr:MAG: Glucosamine-6-phosphate deaminase [Firmicutes bacterium ADurb.Bin080]
MRFILAKDATDVSQKAYDFIRKSILQNPSLTLGLATGSTPLELYKLMINDYKRGNISFKNIRTINLDEYVGLPEGHPQSYRYFMDYNLFNHIDIDKNNTKVPNGSAIDLNKECEDYSSFISKNVQDIQILGIGSNGHIAFNEPGTSFNSSTHIVDLKESTIKDNARFFDNETEVPKKAITMGIKDIMGAKMIILLATGSSKAEAIYRAIKGPITEDCPASVLQSHPNTVILGDHTASFWIRVNREPD